MNKFNETMILADVVKYFDKRNMSATADFFKGCAYFDPVIDYLVIMRRPGKKENVMVVDADFVKRHLTVNGDDYAFRQLQCSVSTFMSFDKVN